MHKGQIRYQSRIPSLNTSSMSRGRTPMVEKKIKYFKEVSFNQAIQQGKYSLRFLVPTQVGGAVIGKGGENVRTIGQKYNASISINDKNTAERVLFIIAKQNVIVDCLRELLPSFCNINPQREAEVRKLVHQSHVGLIIGSKGATVKQLKENTKTFVNIFKEVCPDSTDRVVQINGSEDGVVKAVAQLIEDLSKHPLTAFEQTYDAANHDASLAPLYGGFLAPYNTSIQFEKLGERVQQQQFHQTPGKHNIYIQQAREPSADRPAQQYLSRSTFPRPLRSPSRGPPANRSKSCIGRPVQPVAPVYFSEDFLQNQDQCTVHMAVPKDKIARVIGLNGEVLAQIMRDVGVAIDLSMAFRGTKQQVDVATMLIKERAHQKGQQPHRINEIYDNSLITAANETGYGRPVHGLEEVIRKEYGLRIQED